MNLWYIFASNKNYNYIYVIFSVFVLLRYCDFLYASKIYINASQLHTNVHNTLIFFLQPIFVSKITKSRWRVNNKCEHGGTINILCVWNRNIIHIILVARDKSKQDWKMPWVQHLRFIMWTSSIDHLSFIVMKITADYVCI